MNILCGDQQSITRVSFSCNFPGECSEPENVDLRGPNRAGTKKFVDSDSAPKKGCSKSGLEPWFRMPVQLTFQRDFEVYLIAKYV